MKDRIAQESQQPSMDEDNHRIPENTDDGNVVNYEGAARRNLDDYIAPMVDRCATSIVRPPIQVNNFEIKLALLQLIQWDQFRGSLMEDHNLHISNFLQQCDRVKVNRSSDDAI